MASEDDRITRISELVRRNFENPEVRTLDPQVRTSKYGGLGALRDSGATQDYGERLSVTPFSAFSQPGLPPGSIIDRNRPVSAFAELAKLADEITFVSDYYSNPWFFAYERQMETLVGETQFDLKHFGSRIKKNDSVLDVGFGTGRVLHYLRQTGKKGSLLGVDRSPLAFASASDRLSGMLDDRMTLRLGDVHDVIADGERFDAITLGDCTLNVFTENADVVALLGFLSGHLADKGQILLSVFDDAAVEHAETTMDGLHTVHAFSNDRGETSLVWWAMDYYATDAILHRSAFIDRSKYGQRHLLANLFDRFWTPSRLTPLIDGLGLEIIARLGGTVDGGALKGSTTVTLALRRR